MEQLPDPDRSFWRVDDGGGLLDAEHAQIADDIGAAAATVHPVRAAAKAPTTQVGCGTVGVRWDWETLSRCLGPTASMGRRPQALECPERVLAVLPHGGEVAADR